MDATSYVKLKLTLEALSASPAIDLETHCLLIYEHGGHPRRFYSRLRLESHGAVLYAGSSVPFPLSLLGGGRGLVSVHQASSLEFVWQRVAGQGFNTIMYAPREFQTRFLDRLKAGIPHFDDLFARIDPSHFVLEFYEGDEEPLFRCLLGPALPAELVAAIGKLA